MAISYRKAASWLGRKVCIHWGGDGRMQGEGWQLQDDREGGKAWFIVDYGYGVRISAITAIHAPEDCPGLEPIVDPSI